MSRLFAFDERGEITTVGGGGRTREESEAERARFASSLPGARSSSTLRSSSPSTRLPRLWSFISRGSLLQEGRFEIGSRMTRTSTSVRSCPPVRFVFSFLLSHQHPPLPWLTFDSRLSFLPHSTELATPSTPSSATQEEVLIPVTTSLTSARTTPNDGDTWTTRRSRPRERLLSVSQTPTFSSTSERRETLSLEPSTRLR